MGKIIEILCEGEATDDNGRKHMFDCDWLKRIVENYNERRKNDAPLVVGHPRTDSPAWGWVDKLRLVGGKVMKIVAEAKQVVPEFAEAVRRGMYKYVSVSLRPDDTLKHIGFLGGTPPAVKGLAPVLDLAEADGDLRFEFADAMIEFSEDNWLRHHLPTISRLFQKIREWIIEQKGVEAADKIIPDYDLRYLQEPPPEPEVEARPAFNENKIPPQTGGKEDTEMSEEDVKKKVDAAKAEATSEFSEKLTAKENENKALKGELQQIKADKALREVSDFVESPKMIGKLLPKHKKLISEILLNLKGQDLVIQFSETEKKSGFDAMKEFCEALPVQVPLKAAAGAAGDSAGDEAAEFAEMANVDQDRLELHKKAKALEKKEKIPYADAVRRVMKGGN